MRKIKFEEKDLSFPEDKQDGCIACATGLDHKIYEDFMENLGEDLKDIYRSCEGRSDLVKALLNTFSKAELAFTVEQLITQKLEEEGHISYKEEIDEENSQADQLKKLLKNSLGLGEKEN